MPLDPSAYQHLAFHQEGAVLTLTFNRPDTYNAIDLDLHKELSRVFTDIKRDHSVRAVVLTGAGRAFSAGGNLKGPRPVAGPSLDDFFKDAKTLITDLLDLPQPIVAAINGPAMGLGATLALLCDMTVMSNRAVIGDPHVTVGVVAGDGGVIAWPWLVGMARTKEYLLTGDHLTATEAERIGLVNRIVEPEAVLAEATALAQRFAAAPVKAVQGTKAILNQILRGTANQVLEHALAVEKECFASGDHAAAVEAFLAAKEAEKAASTAG